MQLARAGHCEARGITEYFWTKLGGYVAQYFNLLSHSFETINACEAGRAPAAAGFQT